MSDADSIQTLVEVTGLDLVMAKRVFEVCNNNLEQAINFHLEGNVLDDIAPEAATSNRPPTSELPDLSSASLPYSNDEGVREPIPVKREQLVASDDDIFRSRIRRPLSHTVCPLRNFQLEGELQEAQLSDAFAGTRAGSMVAAAFSRTPRSQLGSSGLRNSKRPRLGDLFRPPVDINYVGTLHGVKEAGKQKDRWIIVNLQDNVQFASQVMNRDIWSDAALKDFIKKYFLFWQVAIDTSEGARFQVFSSYFLLKFTYINNSFQTGILWSHPITIRLHPGSKNWRGKAKLQRNIRCKCIQIYSQPIPGRTSIVSGRTQRLSQSRR